MLVRGEVSPLCCNGRGGAHSEMESWPQKAVSSLTDDNGRVLPITMTATARINATLRCHEVNIVAREQLREDCVFSIGAPSMPCTGQGGGINGRGEDLSLHVHLRDDEVVDIDWMEGFDWLLCAGIISCHYARGGDEESHMAHLVDGLGVDIDSVTTHPTIPACDNCDVHQGSCGTLDPLKHQPPNLTQSYLGQGLGFRV